MTVTQTRDLWVAGREKGKHLQYVFRRKEKGRSYRFTLVKVQSPKLH